MGDYDLYDVLAELGYGMAPRTRAGRAEAFTYKHSGWLEGIPKRAAATIRALAAQFAVGGTEALENVHVFEAPEVRRAGGFEALKSFGKPADALRETKARMFAA
jgi:type I restriction enzyme R subunit